MAAVRARLVRRLAGLTDAEYLWEPVAGCFTLRATDHGWVPDYADAEPEPAPFTTIAWRLSHVTMINRVWADWLFGERRLMFSDIELSGEADTAVRDWQSSFHAFELAFADTPQERYAEMVPRYCGADERTLWSTVWSMISENEHHGAEIGCVRDLYAHRLQPAPDGQFGAAADETSPSRPARTMTSSEATPPG